MRYRKIALTLLLAALCGAVAAKAEDNVVYLSQSEALKAAREKVAPDYPSMARQLRLEGAVKLTAYISEAGTVVDVKPLTGNAVLMNAAVAALKLWKFTPFLIEGKPSRAVAAMSFTFHK
ncbi:MAG: energy transducer TonB [Acidobacteriota bacterium]|nr:energy transducer TonB [Acidobacteriota bacterium]